LKYLKFEIKLFIEFVVIYNVVSCSKHILFFSNDCESCKKEYCIMKGLNENGNLPPQHIIYKDTKQIHYKEFTEEKAKELYEKLFIFYLKNNKDENEVAKKAKRIIKKQCQLRNIEPWNWIKI
jgi:hypothetical protein